ncbi:MAG: hypothetical protein QM706_02525 [Nitrospira sp.]
MSQPQQHREPIRMPGLRSGLKVRPKRDEEIPVTIQGNTANEIAQRGAEDDAKNKLAVVNADIPGLFP